MIYLRWTGLGWLTPLLVLGSFFGGIYGGILLTGKSNILAALFVGMGLMALLSPLHWLLGLALNSEMKLSGRVWHNRHTSFGNPIQYGFVTQLLIALTVESFMLGNLTSPLYGWLLFGGSLVLGLIFAIKMDWQRLLSSVTDRKVFAAERGWVYKAKYSQLGKRWENLFGKKETIMMNPFGVLAGEVEGLPFTAFDSQPGKPKTRRTYWAIHLPVAYPRIQVVETLAGEDLKNLNAAFEAFFAPGGPRADPQVGKILHDFSKKKPPPTPDNLGAQTRNTAFGQALLTLPVRSATVEFGLVGWRIEGRDLIFERKCSRPFTANEVVQTAVHLAKLARTFPADLADRFGTPPSTDIPLRGKDGTAQKRE
ncbi:MAG TPA: hypothetical protein VKP04_08885 [Ktedonobacteraceae bacterium]|nr:hypothetical protein [Ktedonobacteraceae bacterium]